MTEWVRGNDLADRGLTFEEQRAAYVLGKALNDRLLAGEHEDLAVALLAGLKEQLDEVEELKQCIEDLDRSEGTIR